MASAFAQCRQRDCWLVQPRTQQEEIKGANLGEIIGSLLEMPFFSFKEAALPGTNLLVFFSLGKFGQP